MSFEKSEEVEKYANAIIKVFFDVFDHLEEGNIAYLFAYDDIKTSGRLAYGYACLLQVQGKQNKIYKWAIELTLGFQPDAMIVIHKESWEELSDESKVALIYHELRHIKHSESKNGSPKFDKDTGLPIYEIHGHDVEEFEDVAEIFGAWDSGLVGLKDALNKKKRDTGKIKEVLKEVKGKK